MTFAGKQFSTQTFSESKSLRKSSENFWKRFISETVQIASVRMFVLVSQGTQAPCVRQVIFYLYLYICVFVYLRICICILLCQPRYTGTSISKIIAISLLPPGVFKWGQMYQTICLPMSNRDDGGSMSDRWDFYLYQIFTQQKYFRIFLKINPWHFWHFSL